VELIRRFARKILPSTLYLFVASRIYVHLWEMAWRLGLVEATLGDVCRSERAVEYTWALTNTAIMENGRILDVGCKGSLFPILLSGMGFEVWGVDLSDIGRYKSRHPNFRFIKGNVITAPLPENYFDVITIISTIEHVELKNNGDIECMKRLGRLLKENGKIILTTPYGSPALFERSRVYDRERLGMIFEGMRIERMDFFKELELGKWLPAREDEVSKISHTSDEVHSIVCIVARSGSREALGAAGSQPSSGDRPHPQGRPQAPLGLHLSRSTRRSSEDWYRRAIHSTLSP
jgi:2-polyprenyl-3-methyl-5-hydroxy-6-metoxy-1,4-benzoquinol methylase